jgi:hypothetical protein
LNNAKKDTIGKIVPAFPEESFSLNRSFHSGKEASKDKKEALFEPLSFNIK